MLLLFSCVENTDTIQLAKMSDEERWLSEICSSKYKGRRAGTIECDEVADYICQELNGMGYEVFSQPFILDDSLYLKNVFVVFKGISDSLIVVGAHYDGAVYGNAYSAADDNGSGVVALLSICKALSESKIQNNKSILLAFWVAEESTHKKVFNGSRYFITHFNDKDKILYYCNLDCFAHKEQGVYFYYSEGCGKSVDILEDKLIQFPADDIPITIKLNDKSNSDYIPFHLYGIPYFGWNDFDTSDFVHSTRDNVEIISFEKIRKIVKLTFSIVIEL